MGAILGALAGRLLPIDGQSSSLRDAALGAAVALLLDARSKDEEPPQNFGGLTPPGYLV
jgi:hypothetical protein